jgi:hypothetical protein
MGINEALLLVGVFGLLAGVATLMVAVRILRSTQRSELRGSERLEILREQQARLESWNEERRFLLDELRRERAWRESQVQENGRTQLPAVPLALEAPPQLPWWRRIFYWE